MSFIAPSKVDMNHIRDCYYDENGKAKEPLVIDQSMTMKGNENDYGWPESDIALLLNAQSQDEISFYLSRMRDLRLNDEQNKDLTDEQIAAKVIPSNANTPVSYANAVMAAQKYFVESAASRQVVVDRSDVGTVVSSVSEDSLSSSVSE